MVLTPREKNIAIGVGTLLGVLVVYFLIVKPYIGALHDVTDAIETAQAQHDREYEVFKQRKAMDLEWKVIQAAMFDNQGDARQEVRTELDKWAASCGINQKQLNDGKVSRNKDNKDFDVLEFTFIGQGPQKFVASFIYLCETTDRLLRIERITVKPSKEGHDDLNLELTVSTICRRADATPAQRVASYGLQRGNSL